MNTVYFWIGFHVLIIILLFADLGFINRKKKAISFKEACLHSVFWVVLAFLFNGFIYYLFGAEKALQFFTGYLIEKSLSVDNLFIFLILFAHFRIPEIYQHRVLYWGILGALVFRISLILAGVSLIENFHWMYYLLGAFLVITGVNFVFHNQQKRKDPSKSLTYLFLKKILPIDHGDSEGKFIIKRKGKRKVTMLFIVLLLIESADVMFALDSIPAIFAITNDPLIIYTSNVFAILGLRALYLVLSTSLAKLHYYKFGLAAILIFVGAKMMLSDFIHISVFVSLSVIIFILIAMIVFSLKRFRSLKH